ncbi:hypothetical protein [Hymenobacter terrenus]|uniref:hypothetical protein n=1 Tax=Hymenobacter terrenus TaxID=1629124 RepID=UPI0006198865|nr:hypothetical protein [Hymenobacter terrenus]
MGNLLLDKGAVFLTWAGTLWEVAPVRRRDWSDVASGQFVFLLDSGEGLDYGSRTLWAGYVTGNQLRGRGRGRLQFRPTPARPGDDELFEFEGESIRRLLVPVRKIGPAAVLHLPAPAPIRKGGPRRG